MEKAGVIPHSNSPWTFKYGQEEVWRLEAATVPDCYPLPNIADFTSGISGSTIFWKLDLQKGYYQVPVEQEAIQKTNIITPFGMFEF